MIVAAAPNTVRRLSPNDGWNRKITTASTASMKLATVNSGILYSRSFAKLVSTTATTNPSTSALTNSNAIAPTTWSSRPSAASPHGTTSTFNRIT